MNKAFEKYKSVKSTEAKFLKNFQNETVKSSSNKSPLLNKFKDSRRKGWRIIIRNLPFKTTKEDLQVKCSQYGPFTEIVLPACKDERFPNSCAGFAFVQFKVKKDAENAMNEMNLTEINGRKIAVDWAIPKDTYETAVFEEKQKDDVKVQDSAESTENERKLNDIANERKLNENEESEESSSDEASEKKIRTEIKTDKAISEGRVIFLKNLSFDTNDDSLKKAVEDFGEITLAIVCRYADSNHSKGSGFVHFKFQKDADRCLDALQNDPGVLIDGRRVIGHRALQKYEANAKEKESKNKPRDKRNLHLLRASIIRPGTVAARGMSSADAQKRAKLVLSAKSKLQNLHMFVSPQRLVVHNLPPSLTDKALKSLCFLAANNPDAVITECKIWRDKEKLDASGGSRSRGFGFVAFSEHNDALSCLKHLNNNPETFTDEKRPIVEFSIENLSALRLKKSRSMKSQKKLPENKVNDLQIERTKQELSAGGKKPLPTHLGPKIRHRSSKKLITEISKKKKRNRSKSSNSEKVSPKKKRSKFSKSKQQTKFLTLSS